MGWSPETKKRKAPYDPVRDARPPKSARTAPDHTQFQLSPSFMVTVTTALPPRRHGDEPEAVDVRVVGAFPHADQARSRLLDALNAGHGRLARSKTTSASCADVQTLIAQCSGYVHHSCDDATGALCVVQRDLPGPEQYDSQDRGGWLRIGEIIPKGAMRLQHRVMSNSVYIILATVGDSYDGPTPEEGAEIVAVYRSQHEANRHVIGEFNNYGGLQQIPTGSVEADEGDSCDDNEEEHKEQDSMLCFIDGRAKARVTGETTVMTWEVVQKMLL